MVNTSDSMIRVRSCPKCPLCDGDGTPLYSDLKDRLFGVEGSWNLSKCLNLACGGIWLNPMPVEEDLPKAYRTYYTHQAQPRSNDSLPRRLYRRAKRGYLASRYGYYINDATLLDRMMGKLFFFHPGRRADLDFEVFYLVAKKGGRLLEVGCGSGTMLKSMAERGWLAEGVDFDPTAVKKARDNGLTVHLGNLMSQEFSENSFDVVVMSHVIEHVPDPRLLLQECHKVLKSGGRLIMITPNTESLGRQYFSSSWLHLDPPRHLILFNRRNAEKLAADSRFEEISTKTIIRDANNTLIASRTISEIGTCRMRDRSTRWVQLWALSMQSFEWFLLKFRPNLGEEVVLFAKKQ